MPRVESAPNLIESELNEKLDAVNGTVNATDEDSAKNMTNATDTTEEKVKGDSHEKEEDMDSYEDID